MGSCCAKEGYVKLEEFPPLEENTFQNIVCRDYPPKLLKPNSHNVADMKTYRVVLIGDKDVGKTQILNTLQSHRFTKSHHRTIEHEIKIIQKVPIYDNYKSDAPDINDYYQCCLQIMDTAGMRGALDVSDDITNTDNTKLKEWIKKGHIFLIVFDLTNKSTFENIHSFLDEIANTKQMDNPPIILVGNKCDLIFSEHNKEQYSSNLKNNMNVISENEELSEKRNQIKIKNENENENENDNENHYRQDSAQSDTSSFLGQSSNLTSIEHKDEREVSNDDIMSLITEWDIPYVECSAKTSYNVNVIFNIAVKECLFYHAFYGGDTKDWMIIKRTASLNRNDSEQSHSDTFH